MSPRAWAPGVVGVFVFCGIGGAASYAQSSAAGSLTLADVVSATLSANPTIRASDWTLRASEGVMLSAGAPFDPQAQLSLAGAQASTLNSLTAGPLYYLQKQASYTASFTKEFSWGLTVSPSFSLTNTAVSLLPGAAQNASTVGLSLGLPLLRDRWGAITGAAERSAERDYRGATLDLRTTTASTVASAVTAYWSYLAAVRMAAVYGATEARAQRTVDDTKVLVAAEERPPADLNQVLGDLATQHAARLQAEQGVVVARQQLGLVMGLPAAAVDALAAPATDFPATARIDSARLAALVGDAETRRPDVAALVQHRAASHIQTQAARNALLPRLDLQVGLGYNGLASGWGVSNEVGAFGQNVPGLNVTVQLATNLSVLNRAAHGQTEQAGAAEHQEQIAEDDLRRHVRTDVVVAAAALRNSANGLDAAVEAVGHANETVEAQRQRFKSGLATVFDVLLAEDALTNAQLTEIASRQAYADAIVTLRYASGTLITDGPRLVIAADAFITPP